MANRVCPLAETAKRVRPAADRPGINDASRSEVRAGRAFAGSARVNPKDLKGQRQSAYLLFILNRISRLFGVAILIGVIAGLGKGIALLISRPGSGRRKEWSRRCFTDMHRFHYEQKHLLHHRSYCRYHYRSQGARPILG